MYEESTHQQNLKSIAARAADFMKGANPTNYGGADVGQRMPEIARELQSLTENLTRLQTMANKLEDRLAPILQKTDAKPGGNPQQSCCTQLGGDLQSLSDSTRRTADMITSLCSRLEI